MKTPHEIAKSITPEGVEYLGDETQFPKDSIDTDKYEYECITEGELNDEDIWTCRDWRLDIPDHATSPFWHWYRRPKDASATDEEKEHPKPKYAVQRLTGFDARPFSAIHKSLEITENEAIRLANKYPNSKFAVVQVLSIAESKTVTELKPFS